jgi:hypothetical protein
VNGHGENSSFLPFFCQFQVQSEKPLQTAQE